MFTRPFLHAGWQPNCLCLETYSLCLLSHFCLSWNDFCPSPLLIKIQPIFPQAPQIQLVLQFSELLVTRGHTTLLYSSCIFHLWMMDSISHWCVLRTSHVPGALLEQLVWSFLHACEGATRRYMLEMRELKSGWWSNSPEIKNLASGWSQNSRQEIRFQAPNMTYCPQRIAPSNVQCFDLTPPLPAGW